MGISGRHVTIDLGPDTSGNAAMSDEDLKAELERLRSENAALKKGASTSIRMKVSEKGAVSIYGMGRFPVTLYKEQWQKLLDMSDDIRAFIAANEGQLRKRINGAQEFRTLTPNHANNPRCRIVVAACMAE